MNFFKALFSGKEETPQDRKEEEDAKNFDVLKYDGVRALRSNEAEYAVKCFTHALQIKDDLEVRDYLSQAYIRRGEFKSAIDQLQNLAEKQPDNLQVLIRMANVLFMMEEYDAMLEVCEKAMQIDDKSLDAIYFYARACIGKGKTNDALEALTIAISLNDNFYDAYLLRSDMLLKSGNIERADEDAVFLLNNIADNEDILMLKARIESAKGNDNEAISFYDSVINVNPFNVNAYRERGNLKIKTGDESGAQEDFDRANEYALQENVGEEGENIEEKVKQAYRDVNPMGL